MVNFPVKAIIIITASVLFSLILALVFFPVNVIDIKQLDGPRNLPVTGYPFGPQLLRGRVVRQTFKPRASYISGFAVLLTNTKKKKAEGYVTFRLKKRKDNTFITVFRTKIKAAPIIFDTLIPVNFPQISVKKGTEYAVEISGNAKKVGLSTWVSFKDSYKDGKAYLNGRSSKNRDIAFLTYYKTNFLIKTSLLVTVFLAAISGAAVIAVSFKLSSL